MNGAPILARLRAFAAGPGFKRALGWFEVLLGIAAAGYLAWRLSHIGWVEVLRALPTNPVFYLLLAPRLLAIPVSELVIYQRLWARPLLGAWRAFLKKLAYNFGFLEYTGELYFAGWAPRALGLPARTILSSLRDVNILSALIANVATALLFAVLFLTGQVRRLLQSAPDIAPYFIIAGVFIFTITLAGLLFRKRLIGLETRDAAFVAWVHLVRVIAVVLLQAAQWWVAIPSASFGVWLVFLTTNMMLTRVPLLPSRELVFAGISLELLDLVDAPQARVAATFASSSALMQLGYMGLLVLTTVWRARKNAGSAPAQPT